jgi:hypothetical protein
MFDEFSQLVDGAILEGFNMSVATLNDVSHIEILRVSKRQA